MDLKRDEQLYVEIRALSSPKILCAIIICLRSGYSVTLGCY
jgi:hypothetical protein